MLVARRFLLTGRVQGVGFRYFALEAAMREQLTGLVRNRRDGSVEVVAEGDAEAMTRFEMTLRRGPTGSRVDEVETDADIPTGLYRDFSIKG